MQGWDQVQVKTGEFAGKAGLVVRTNEENQIATVKLDQFDAPIEFAYAELKQL